MLAGKPIIKGDFKLQKMEGKGGWTFAILPSQQPKTGLPFGWYVVKGTIDDCAINQFKLWPTSDGQMFLPVKSEIRKKIKKEVGSMVHIVLFEDKSEIIVPAELMLCLQDFPKALTFFNNLSDTSKKQYVDHIYSTKNLNTRADRISKAIDKLEAGLKWHEKPKE